MKTCKKCGQIVQTIKRRDSLLVVNPSIRKVVTPTAKSLTHISITRTHDPKAIRSGLTYPPNSQLTLQSSYTCQFRKENVGNE